MKSRAAIANHPIHPMLVPLPIGAFVLAFVGDVLHVARPADRFWYDLAYTCIGFGIVFAIPAAVAGAVDYIGVTMTAKAFRTATRHLVLIVSSVLLYLVSFLIRRDGAAMAHGRWALALATGLAAFALLAVAGWLGGALAHVHRVGVADAEAHPARSHHRERAAS